MKRIIYVIFLCVLTLGVGAQTSDSALQNKKGYAILPQAGDFAVGVDAMPYLQYLGNAFNGNTYNTLNLGESTIYGKYYLSADEAIRAELYINKNKDQNTQYVRDGSQQATDPRAQVEDLQIINRNSYGIGVGYQRYRGYNRLRGTYGAAGYYYLNRETTNYSWGNEMTSDNNRPTSYNWYGAGTTPTSRYIDIDNDLSQTVSLGVLAGVEYFFLPKICIGGEFGLYMSYNWNSQANYSYEMINEQGQYQVMEEPTSPSDNYFSLTTQVYSTSRVAGRLYLLFHF